MVLTYLTHPDCATSQGLFARIWVQIGAREGNPFAQRKRAVRPFSLGWVGETAPKPPKDLLKAPVYWWRWRELNPRPQILRLRLYMLIPAFGFNCQLPDGQGRQTAIP